MRRLVSITGDWNDGDFVTEEHELNDADLTLLREILMLIINNPLVTAHGIEWKTGDRQTGDIALQFPELLQDQIDFFQDLLPSSEWGLHTITRIRVLNEVEDLF